MAQRAVVWTDTASFQFRAILKFWVERNRSEKYSLRLIDLVEKNISIILEHPKAFKQAEFLNTRVASLGHYSIYYEVSAEQIVVTAFWDNRQDPAELLDLLQKS